MGKIKLTEKGKDILNLWFNCIDVKEIKEDFGIKLNKNNLIKAVNFIGSVEGWSDDNPLKYIEFGYKLCKKDFKHKKE